MTVKISLTTRFVFYLRTNIFKLLMNFSKPNFINPNITTFVLSTINIKIYNKWFVYTRHSHSRLRVAQHTTQEVTIEDSSSRLTMTEWVGVSWLNSIVNLQVLSECLHLVPLNIQRTLTPESTNFPGGPRYNALSAAECRLKLPENANFKSIVSFTWF